MPVILDTPHSSSAVAAATDDDIIIGFVNNMPDTAWQATERQFIALMQAAAGDAHVRLQLFSITDLPRADHVRRELADRYRDVSALWNARLDGLIVTGTEPRAANLKDEPYWPTFATLVDWARHYTVSTIWSCLAAHAAVLHADGIERRAFADKQFGVFDCDVVGRHRMTKGAGGRLRVPHSRWNDLPEEALAGSGYRILTRSAAVGVDMFVGPERRTSSSFLFFQGHPEYEAGTLLREYRRDIGRFLRGEREHYPAMPQGYFDEEAGALVNAFRARALRDRDEELLAEFPMRKLDAGLEVSWRRSATGVYQRWLEHLKERKGEARILAMPRPRSSRRNWSKPIMRPAAGGSSGG